MQNQCGGSTAGNGANLISSINNIGSNATSRSAGASGGGCPMGGQSSQSDSVGGQSGHNNIANQLIALLQQLVRSY